MLTRTLLVLGALLSTTVLGNAQSVDVLILGGRVIDGTGNPWFLADVAVGDGRIVAVGRLSDLTARRTIDARVPKNWSRWRKKLSRSVACISRTNGAKALTHSGTSPANPRRAPRRCSMP